MVGLIVCGILITFWTFFVMKAVPQFSSGDTPSLDDAQSNGCISTIPLTTIIRQQRKSLDWIAEVVEIFIVVSVTVSFIAVGSGLKNFIDGHINTFVKIVKRNSPVAGHLSTPSITFILKYLAYFFSFAISVGFAIGKPSCFLVVLEYFTSLALNLENGFFISHMVILAAKHCNIDTAKNSKAPSANIPVQLQQPWGVRTAYITSLFFHWCCVLFYWRFFVQPDNRGRALLKVGN